MKPRNSWSGSVSRMMGFPWKKDFIGWKLLEARVAKNESVVHIADVFDEEMMVGKELSWLKLMDQICSLMETTMRQRAGESGLPIGLPLRCRNATLAQSKGLHIKRRREKGWDIFDDYFPCDI